MADYVLSNKTDADLGEIYAYSHQTFGEARADAYFLELEQCLTTLAGHPGMGRSVDHLLPGLLRHVHQQHAIFYLIEGNDIFIVRILHHGMETQRHLDATD